MRVAIEQARGEKYRSMGASWRFGSQSAISKSGCRYCVRPRSNEKNRTGVDFYTVSHNINPVKGICCDMVQKSKKPAAVKLAAAAAAPKRRGRPRAYRPEVALGKALDLFRKDGFAATSLDDLSAATGMNRPSLYGAFGDKRELYIKSYRRYREDARAAMQDTFREEQPVRQLLQRIYAVA